MPSAVAPPLPTSVLSWLRLTASAAGELPRAAVPPPERPAPAGTVNVEFWSIALVTPPFGIDSMIELPSETGPPPLRPAPAVTVTEELCSIEFCTRPAVQLTPSLVTSTRLGTPPAPASPVPPYAALTTPLLIFEPLRFEMPEPSPLIGPST